MKSPMPIMHDRLLVVPLNTFFTLSFALTIAGGSPTTGEQPVPQRSRGRRCFAGGYLELVHGHQVPARTAPQSTAKVMRTVAAAAQQSPVGINANLDIAPAGKP